jgi:homoserine acetyltransferase
MVRAVLSLLILMIGATPAGAQHPGGSEGDFTLKDFTFASGEAMPELRLHYRTLGRIQRDDRGLVRNAVLILHGTGGGGEQFLRPEFAGELYGRGRLLDTTRYFFVLPGGIGHGRSSKPSDGLRARFPSYGYRDMIDDSFYDAAMGTAFKTADANDLLHQVEASRDYDPGPLLTRIRAPLTAVNFADDLVNPPELGILEREIGRVPKGRAVVVPAGPETRGHGTHTLAAVWKRYLEELLARSAGKERQS